MKKIFTTLFLMGITLYSQAQIPTAGLVAYYPFNGNANDGSGNNYNGTVNGASLTNDRFGNPNSAYSFDGINDNITLNSTLSLTNIQSKSVWVYLNSSNPNQNIIVEGGAIQWMEVVDIDNDKKPEIRYGFESTLGNYIESNLELDTLQWYNLILTSDASNVMKLYINGVLDSQLSGTPQTIGNINIGSGVSSYFFNGKIDDIRIYNRTITPAEVTQIYSFSGCNADISTGLVAQYDFTGNANDQSTNANNGTISGASLVADRFGNSNSAYYYDGINNYIEIPNISAYNNQLYTISYWTKFSTASTSGSGGFNVNPALISKLAPSASVTYDNWVFYEGNGTPGFAYGTAGYGGSAALFNDNNWHNIVCSVNNDSVRFYYDGVQTDKVAKGPNLIFNTQPIRIGRSMATYWKAFNGIIDDIRIYNIPLTACDIDSLYNMPNPTTVGITQLNNNEIFKIYPNPAKDFINIKNAKGNYIITDLLGQVVKQIEITSTTQAINIQELNSGVYFLISNEDNSSKKFIISK